MRVVFFGTPAVAVPTLEAAVRAGHDVECVVTQPDRPIGRSRQPQPPPVKRAALELGLRVEQPERVRGRRFRELSGGWEPDVLVVVAYGKILPRRLLELPRKGPLNLHFSLLPAYRGAAPVQWALANGETTTGVSSMLMNERLDEGDLLLQRAVAIEPGEHAPALQSRLAEIGAELLVETLEGLERDSITSRRQESAAASYAPLLRAEDGNVDPALPAHQIEGRVRGFDPWPGVWLRRAGRRLRLVDARATDGTCEARPGRVLELVDEGLLVACGGGSRLLVGRLQPEGRREMTAGDAINGRQIALGDLLSD